MSEILNTPEVPVAQVEFFFSLQANAEGVTELKFAKQVEPVFGTLLTALDYINQTFDQPYLTVGEFLRNLANTADQIEAAYAVKQPTEEAGIPAS